MSKSPIPPLRPSGVRGFAAGFSLLMIRGLLLWLVVPLATVLWLPLWPLLRAQNVSIGQFLGWVDLNLVALIERTVLRPLLRNRFPWTAVRAMPDVTHRIGILDPA
jgi:hypothetical protein